MEALHLQSSQGQKGHKQGERISSSEWTQVCLLLPSHFCSWQQGRTFVLPWQLRASSYLHVVGPEPLIPSSTPQGTRAFANSISPHHAPFCLLVVFYLGKSSSILPLYIWGMKKWDRDQYPVLGLQVRVTELPPVSIITLAKGKGALGRVRQGFAGSSSEPEPRRWSQLSPDQPSHEWWFPRTPLP